MKNPAAVALGRLGGKATSEAKAAAARENAKKGGWPKGKKRKPKRVARRSNSVLVTGEKYGEYKWVPLSELKVN